MFRCVFWLCLALSVLGGSASAAERAAVTGLRAADHDGITWVVLDLSRPVAYALADGGTPARIGLDLPDAAWQVALPGLLRPIGLLKDFRYDSRNGRLLLEATRAVHVEKAFTMMPRDGGPYRLVLHLAPGETLGTPRTAEAADAGMTAPLPPPKPILSLAGGNPILGAPPPGPGRPPEGTSIASGPIPSPRQPVAAAPAPPAVQPTPAALVLPDPIGTRRGDRSGKPLVMIDPGHGGIDPGATSLSGEFEKNIVLALAQEVKAVLDKDGKVRCELTRDGDVFIPLRQRVAIARANHADLFMSLHADTVADETIRGLSVYTLSRNASDAEAEALADKENKADIVAGVDLSNESPEVTNILIDLVQRESMNRSAVFAHDIIREVSSKTHQLLQNTHRFAGFAVLKAPDIPSVLVETGYLSNPDDERMLRQPQYRAKLAQALAHAIERFFGREARTRHG